MDTERELGVTSAQLEVNLGPALAERARQGLALTVVALAVFLLFDLLLTRRNLEVLTIVQAFRLAAFIAAYAILRARPTRSAAMAVAMFVVAVLALSSSVMSSIRGEYESNALLCVTLAMGTATLLPWGLRAQTVTVAVLSVALIENLWAVERDLSSWIGHPAPVMVVVAFATSMFIAFDIERRRRMLAVRLAEARAAEAETRAYHDLVGAMHQTELKFLSFANSVEVFDTLLKALLDLTQSRLGFIGEALTEEPGETPYIRTRAVRWSDAALAEARASADDADAATCGGDRPAAAGEDPEGARGPSPSDGDAAAGEPDAGPGPDAIELRNLEELFDDLLKSHRPMILDEAAVKARLAALPPGHPRFASVLALPLLAGDTLVGVVAIADRPDGYDENLIEYLRPFVATCAYLTNAYHQERFRARAEEEVRKLNADLERRVTERTVDLEQANRELVLANRELESFSYMVSHDLRGPLRAISGFSQVMLDDYREGLDPDAVEYLERIRDGGLRLGRLIDDLLTLGRVTRSVLRRTRVALSDMVAELARRLEQDSPCRNVAVAVEQGLFADGDEVLLRVALGQLLDNAWKFTASNDAARVEFGAAPVDGGRAYFVRDNGVGFDMEYAGKLFKPFERLHDAGDFAGTGMGLAIVERIIYRHGGRAWAESTPGQGATFYFTLNRPDAAQ